MTDLYNKTIYDILLYNIIPLSYTSYTGTKMMIWRINKKYKAIAYIQLYKIKFNLLYFWKWNYRFIKKYNQKKSLHIFTYYLYIELKIYDNLLEYIICNITDIYSNDNI